jgi:hypothetical protein
VRAAEDRRAGLVEAPDDPGVVADRVRCVRLDDHEGVVGGERLPRVPGGPDRVAEVVGMSKRQIRS